MAAKEQKKAVALVAVAEAATLQLLHPKRSCYDCGMQRICNASSYKELGFIDEHRIDNAPNKIYIPDSVKLRSREYVIGNDELLQWFDKEFEITNDKKDHVTLKDLYASFKLSDIWHNLDKNERRTNFNYKNFSENVKSNIKLRKLYKERTNKIKQVLIGVKQIEEDEVDRDSN